MLSEEQFERLLEAVKPPKPNFIKEMSTLVAILAVFMGANTYVVRLEISNSINELRAEIGEKYGTKSDMDSLRDWVREVVLNRSYADARRDASRQNDVRRDEAR